MKRVNCLLKAKGLNNLLKDYKNPEPAVWNVIRRSNMQRVVYLAIVAFILNAYHIIVFYHKFSVAVDPMECQWTKGIAECHLASMIFFLFVGLFFFFQLKKKKLRTHLINFFFIATFIFMIALGAAIVSFDQIVTPAITPYLILCTIISLVILLPPIFIIPLFLSSYIFFFFGISLFQQNPDIILSNRVNGITANFLGILISLIYWKNTITRYRQRLIIEQQNNDLEKKIAELREVNESKDKLFSIIAHDLTSPFNLITGMTGLLAEDFQRFSTEQIEKFLSEINKTSLQTQSLLFELLTWARLQTGNITFNPVDFELFSVCKNITDILTPIASAKNLTLKIDVDPTISVHADMEMVKTILRNLVSNAVKYSFPEGEITISVKQNNNQVQVDVTDQGTGIDPDKIEKLFSKSGKQSTPGTSNEQGVGLGLTLCNEFVEKNGGTIWVKSTPNQGSRFSFTLQSA